MLLTLNKKMLAGLLLAIEILCQDLSNVKPTKSSFRHGRNHRKERQELSQLQSADSIPLPEFDAKIKVRV